MSTAALCVSDMHFFALSIQIYRENKLHEQQDTERYLLKRYNTKEIPYNGTMTFGQQKMYYGTKVDLLRALDIRHVGIMFNNIRLYRFMTFAWTAFS